MLPLARHHRLLHRPLQVILTRTLLSNALEARIQALVDRHAQAVQDSLTNPQAGKEVSSLSKVASLYNQRQTLLQDQAVLHELVHEAKQSDDLDDCQDEIDAIDAQITQLDASLLESILPDQESTASDALLEIRAGTGGDEASLFARELYEAYQKAGKQMGYKIEVYNESKTEIGGLREASLRLSGSVNDLTAHQAFLFESGVHRVQRVPVNDIKLQTSACSVAVLPFESQSDNIEPLPMSDLLIETMRASGAGGQHVNTTDSAVRITHTPTGITASIQDDRSQHKNRVKALQVVTARVRDQEQRQAMEARGQLRSTLMGGGDRSERIRTYNYPQDRITDHRCKTTHSNIAGLLESSTGEEGGLVMAFWSDLKRMHREEMIQQLEQSESAAIDKNSAGKGKSKDKR
jgi:peptide chain release factor 1